MGDVIEFAPPPEEYDGMTCSRCGSAWFTVQAVALDQNASVTAHVAPLACRECGLVRVGGAWVKPDLTEVAEPCTQCEGGESRCFYYACTERQDERHSRWWCEYGCCSRSHAELHYGEETIDD